MKYFVTVFTLFLTLFLSSPTVFSAESVRFAVPPWPGVTVKTEIACQLLEALGYSTEQLEIGSSITYQGLVSDEVDAFLGAWIPQQNPMLLPLLEQGKVEVVQTNLDGAVISLCVPEYVAAAGVKTFADLDGFRDKFEHTLYNIEVGSAMNKEMETIIENDVAGLGDWEQVNTTTPLMLQQVLDKVNEKKWVAWGCWKPHWMNLLLDMCYLDPVPGTEKFASDSKVYTLVNTALKTRHPEVYRFLKQLVVTSPMQSQWIMDYGRKKLPAEKVARSWIASHKKTVAKWVQGVKAADGSAAMKKIGKAF